MESSDKEESGNILTCTALKRGPDGYFVTCVILRLSSFGGKQIRAPIGNGPIFFCHQAALLICSSAAKWKISQEAHGQSGHLGVVGLGSEFFHFS
jgi:hypothetical protein